jgi:hypothetical protein
LQAFSHSTFSTSFFRLFRVTRILRLIKKARQLNKLFTTLILALPSLFNIGMLLLIFFYIFAIVGVEACGMVQMEGNPGLSPNVNFKNFYYAVLTLFQLCTTEGWVDVAEGCAWRSPTCEAVDPRMCGNPWSFPFIMISMLVGAFVLLNAIVSTVIQVFTDSGFREDTMAVFDIFRRRWAQLDVGRSRQIPVRSFLVILRTLPPPIGPNPFVSDDGPKTEYGRMIALLTDLRIPVSIYGEVHYDQVVAALSRKLFDVHLEDYNEDRVVIFNGLVPHNGAFCVHHLLAQERIMRWIAKWRNMARASAQAKLPVTRVEQMERAASLES